MQATTGRSRSLAFRLMIALIAGLCGTSAIAQRASPDSPEDFIVKIEEGQMDLSPSGVTSHDCILVLPDGSFHLELRRQELPASTATLHIYESSLDPKQLEALRAILNNRNIGHLPPYAEPQIPMAVPWSGNFVAKIARPPQIQMAGYWLWRGGAPEVSPNSASTDTKKGWRDSETALKPLVDWFHKVKGVKRGPSGAKSTFCSEKPADD